MKQLAVTINWLINAAKVAKKDKNSAQLQTIAIVVFSPSILFFLFLFKGDVYNDLISDHGLLSQTFDQNDDET